MSDNIPDITVILVEYLSSGSLDRCLRSLLPNLGDLRSEVIVVSNSVYNCEGKRALCQVVPNGKVIFSSGNLGFAKAVNVGLRNSRGRFVLLINPDCELADGRFVDSFQLLSTNPMIAVLGPKIVDEDGITQESCRRFMTPWRFATRVMRRLLGLWPDQPFDGCANDGVRPVDWVSGACMLVRRAAIDQVGMMDERYFMYVEDMDWCRNFRAHGYEVVYWPHLVVRHAGQHASSRALSRWRPSKLMWIHFASFTKYVLKWAWA